MKDRNELWRLLSKAQAKMVENTLVYENEQNERQIYH